MLRSLRRKAASVIVATGAVLLAVVPDATGFFAITWAIPPLLFVSAWLLQARALGAQALARGVLWSSLVLGVVFVATASGTADLQASVITSTTAGLALLLLGREALVPGGRSAQFAPLAFRTTLSLALVLAVGDLLSLAYFSGVYAEIVAVAQHRVAVADALVVFGCTLATVAAIVGLFRLRFWGLVGNAGVNAVVAALAATGALPLPFAVRAALIMTAAAQLVLVTPIAWRLVLALSRANAAYAS